jgi:hypothetical protein
MRNATSDGVVCLRAREILPLKRPSEGDDERRQLAELGSSLSLGDQISLTMSRRSSVDLPSCRTNYFLRIGFGCREFGKSRQIRHKVISKGHECCEVAWKTSWPFVVA